jgi:hypothetical protein
MRYQVALAWSFSFLLGCSSAEFKKEGIPLNPVLQKDPLQKEAFGSAFKLVAKKVDDGYTTLVFELSENIETFAKKIQTEEAFQLQYHEFWGQMAKHYGLDTHGFSFHTTYRSNTDPIQLHIEGKKKGPVPGYLQRPANDPQDNTEAFNYILAQLTSVPRLKDPRGSHVVTDVVVVPMAKSFITGSGTRLVVPHAYMENEFKTIVDFSRTATAEERKAFWGLVGKEIQRALAGGHTVQMGVHCGNLHGQTVGHFHYRLTMSP